MAGCGFEFNRFHATLEQGGTAFKDDQRVYLPPGTNLGNRTSPFLGQWLTLSNLNQAYRARGTSKYSKVLVTANPFSWIDLSGQFLYSLPSSDVNLTQDNTGNFFSLDSFAFFTSEQLLATTQAKQPHTSGSFGAEIRPHRRIRVIESFTTDRFHTTSNLVSLVDKLTPGAGNDPGRHRPGAAGIQLQPPGTQRPRRRGTRADSPRRPPLRLGRCHDAGARSQPDRTPAHG